MENAASIGARLTGTTLAPAKCRGECAFVATKQRPGWKDPENGNEAENKGIKEQMPHP